MKKFARFFMAAVVTMAFVGMTSCKDDDKPATNSDPTPEEYTESTSFAINYEGNAVAAGQTAVFNHTSGLAHVDFEIVNKTNETQEVYFYVEKVEGPEIMAQMSFCTEMCEEYTCPFRTRNAYSVAPNNKRAFDMQFMNGAEAGTTALYKMTAGSGRNLEDPQVIFVRVTL